MVIPVCTKFRLGATSLVFLEFGVCVEISTAMGNNANLRFNYNWEYVCRWCSLSDG